jgi:hypothetical protein
MGVAPHTQAGMNMGGSNGEAHQDDPTEEPVPEPPAPKVVRPSDQEAAEFAADNLKNWSNEQDRLEAEATRKK